MAREKEVEIERTVDGERITGHALPSQLGVLARHGWTLVDDGTSETDLGTPGADDHEEAPETAFSSTEE